VIFGREKEETTSISDWGILIRFGFAFHFFSMPNPKSQIRSDILVGLSANLDKGAQIFPVAKTTS
jgi:hypothetical protein